MNDSAKTGPGSPGGPAPDAERVINVSAAYAFLSALSRDLRLLPGELAACQDDLRRHVAALANDPAAALSADPGRPGPYLPAAAELIGRSDELRETLADTLTGRYRAVKSDAAVDLFLSHCATLPRVFHENNAPGRVLFRYLCELSANFLTAAGIPPEAAETLGSLGIGVPAGTLTAKGRVVLSGLFVAAVEFITAHQPHILYELARRRELLFKAAKNGELIDFIREAADVMPAGAGEFGLFETGREFRDEESAAMAGNVSGIVRKAASAAQSANLLGAGEESGEDESGAAGEYPAFGMSGLYAAVPPEGDRDAPEAADGAAPPFREIPGASVSRKIGRAAAPRDVTGSFGDIDLIREFRIYLAEQEREQKRIREQNAAGGGAALSPGTYALIEKIARDVERFSGKFADPGPDVPAAENAGAGTPAGETPDGGRAVPGDDIFSDEEMLVRAMAEENARLEREEREARSGGAENPAPEEPAAAPGEAGPAASGARDEEKLGDEISMIIRQSEIVRTESVPVYPDPAAARREPAAEEISPASAEEPENAEAEEEEPGAAAAEAPVSEPAPEEISPALAEEPENAEAEEEEPGAAAAEVSVAEPAREEISPASAEEPENAEAEEEEPGAAAAAVPVAEPAGEEISPAPAEEPENAETEEEESGAAPAAAPVAEPAAEEISPAPAEEPENAEAEEEEPGAAQAAVPVPEPAAGTGPRPALLLGPAPGKAIRPAGNGTGPGDAGAPPGNRKKVSLMEMFRLMFRIKGGKPEPVPAFNDVDHRSVPMDRLAAALNRIDAGRLSPEAAKLLGEVRSAVTESPGTPEEVMEWLGFVGNPLAAEGRRARIVRRWALLLLSLRLRMSGKDVSGFPSAGKGPEADVARDGSLIAGNLELVLQQIERMQILSASADEFGLPPFIPLPPLYPEGREGGLRIRRDDRPGGGWRLNFTFDPRDLGAVRIQAELSGKNVKIGITAEKFETLRLINGAADRYRGSLGARGLTVEELTARMGTVYPPSA